MLFGFVRSADAAGLPAQRPLRAHGHGRGRRRSSSPTRPWPRPFRSPAASGASTATRTSTRATATSTQGDFVGYLQNHEIKVGGAYIKRTTEAIDIFTGGQQVSKRIDEDSGRSTTRTRSSGRGSGGGEAVPVPFNDVHLNSIDYSAFVQDSWKVLPNLTADVGIRFDRTDVKGFDGSVVSRLTNAVAAARRRDLGSVEAGHRQGLRLLRPLLLRDPDRHQRPRLRQRAVRHDVQLRPAQHGARPDGAQPSAPGPAGRRVQRARRSEPPRACTRTSSRSVSRRRWTRPSPSSSRACTAVSGTPSTTAATSTTARR